MIIYGAGGHAKVVAKILLACGDTLTHIFDDDLSKSDLKSYPQITAYDPDLYSEEKLMIAIGNNHFRKLISMKTSHKPANAIHPSALIDIDINSDWGIMVMHHAVIQTGSRVGKHVIINTSSIIEHDCVLGDFVHVGPGAVLCGNVSVGENTLIGANSTIIPKIRIGKNCIIGAGTVVIRDVPDFATVCGNPGKIIKIQNTHDGKDLAISAAHERGGNEIHSGSIR